VLACRPLVCLRSWPLYSSSCTGVLFEQQQLYGRPACGTPLSSSHVPLFTYCGLYFKLRLCACPLLPLEIDIRRQQQLVLFSPKTDCLRTPTAALLLLQRSVTRATSAVWSSLYRGRTSKRSSSSALSLILRNVSSTATALCTFLPAAGLAEATAALCASLLIVEWPSGAWQLCAPLLPQRSNGSFVALLSY
jgi:hypothetical protein